jgi:hypothetical protein
MVTYPKYNIPEMLGSNEMLKLKFCTVPAKPDSISRGKTIYSLDDMLTRIKGLFDNLINN